MKKRIRAFGNISKIRIVTRKTGDRFGFESDRLEIRERILSVGNPLNLACQSRYSGLYLILYWTWLNCSRKLICELAIQKF
ncbi:unnamed protein product [Rhizophagus irregularis]|nr:unnamed protein product [Rhizophagus irregularis]